MTIPVPDPNTDLCDLAALYALEALDPGRTRAFDLHLEGCSRCRAELAEMGWVAKQLVHAVDPVFPPPSVKARLLERVRTTKDAAAPTSPDAEPAPTPGLVSQVWKRWEASPSEAMVFTSAKSGDWYEVAPRIRVKPLFVDSVEKMVTMLVEMGPGTAYPAHRHSRGEECYVIAGDLTVDGQLLRAGDYQRAGGGSVHTTQSTHEGCLLLIRSSQEDELLAGR